MVGTIFAGKIGCPKACTHEYVPVCGTDGDDYKMFGNECSMEAEICKTNRGIKFAMKFSYLQLFSLVLFICVLFLEFHQTNDADCPDYADYMK